MIAFQPDPIRVRVGAQALGQWLSSRRASNLHPRLISSFVSLLPRARRGMAQRLALRQQICPVRHGAQISSRHWTRQAWNRASAPAALCIGEFEAKHAQLLTTTTSLDAPARKQAGYGVVSGRLAWLNSSGLLR
ncbi:hypothetical protein FSOLCH5_007085 [Fusarium solani]|uniref:uncharacterized protein n=1 Tax=Fusarium solani TaxID=169388 RepID=UPI0032C45D92|nr:hypothetical protein MRS44_002681 [Fusarium solani]